MEKPLNADSFKEEVWADTSKTRIENDVLFDTIFEPTKKQVTAFTLAEVLITLGIIGVVAAMTLPAIIDSTQDKVLESQYKKCRNIVDNGYKLMMAKSSSFTVGNLPFLSTCNYMNDLQCVSTSHKEAFNIVDDYAGGLNSDLLTKEYIVQGKSKKSKFKWEDVDYAFAATDGMIFGVIPDNDFESFSVVADVNGKKNPNIVKKDLYKFKYVGYGKLSDASSELEVVPECTRNNPSGCITEEECLALNGRSRTSLARYGLNELMMGLMSARWDAPTDAPTAAPTEPPTEARFYWDGKQCRR